MKPRIISVLFVAAMFLTMVAQSGAVYAVSKATSAKVSLPSGPKVLNVVAGQPFKGVPSTGSSRVSIVMCAEETEPATFTVTYSKSVPKVRVAAGVDFVGPGKIERKNVEVSRVDGDMLVNQVSSTSGATFTETDIGPAPTQFWVNVTVSKRTPPGFYKGVVSFYAQNKVLDVVPIEVKVLPLRLIGSSKQYALYTTYGPGAAAPCNMMGSDYTAFLGSFRKLGIRQVSVNCDPAKFGEAMCAYSSAGMSGPAPVIIYSFSNAVPTVEEVKSLANAASAAGQRSLLFFPVDQPITADEISAAQEQARVFRQARARAVCRIADETALATLKSSIDGVDFHVDVPYVQSLIKCEASRTSSQWEWLWWDARKSATDNRLFAGVGLWKSGLDGCMPAWMPEDGKSAWDGVRSLRAEALREGIDDTRYLTTYMKALRELKDKKRDQDKDYISATETCLANFMKKPLDGITVSDLCELRSKMAEYSMKLESML